MSKQLLKIISLALIFVLIAPMVNDAFNAVAVFAADNNNDKNKEETGDLPLEKINREHFFRMVELCWPKYLQKLIRKLANTAIDKVIEGVLKLIPVIGGILGSIYDSLKVFRKMIDLPIYPSCTCMKDDNTQDSAWLPLNWRFAQNYINETLSNDHKPRIVKMEKNQHPMFPSADISGYSAQTYDISRLGTEFTKASDALLLYHNVLPEKYEKEFFENFNKIYPNYDKFTNVWDEQQRLSDRWRKVQVEYLKYVHEIDAALNDSKQTPYRASRWEAVLKDSFGVNKDKAQTEALQYAGVAAKLDDEAIERVTYTNYAFAEIGITAMQNKKSFRQAARKNIDLMGRNAANKKIVNKKTKLGF